MIRQARASLRLSMFSSASPLVRLYRDRDRSTPSLAIVPERWRHVAVDADITDDHIAGLVVWITAGLVITSIAGLLFGPWFAGALLASIISAPIVVVARWRGRRGRRLVAALPIVVEMIARSLRSGASLVQAVAEAEADAPPIAARELRRMTAEIELGRGATPTLRAWAERNEQVEIRIVAAALAFASENESGTSQALAGVGQSLRDRAALSAEIRAHAAQALASMQALVFLPIGFLVIDAITTQQSVRYLVINPLGRICLGSGLVLDALGWIWMRALVRSRMPV